MNNLDDRINDIMSSALEAGEILSQLDNAFDELNHYKNIFPLQTIQSMAERWGVSRQTVVNWSNRNDDFPRELDGLIEQTAKTPKVYALCDVLKYEQQRRIK